MIRPEIYRVLLGTTQPLPPQEAPTVPSTPAPTNPPAAALAHTPLKAHTFSQSLKSLTFLEPEPTSIIEENVPTDAKQAVMNFPGRHYLGKLAANGNREVAILVPPSTDLSRPLEVMYYFHGHGGRIASALEHPSKGFGDKLQSMAQNAARNLVYIIPQGPPKDKDATWMNPANGESIQDFQTDTEALLSRLNQGSTVDISSRTALGHSAGGLPLMNGMRNGFDLNRMVFLDGSYGWWATAAYQAAQDRQMALEMHVIYRPGTSTETDALRLKGKVNLLPSSISHGAIPKYFISRY